MTDNRSQALQYLHDHQNDTLQSLQELLAIPTVSTSPDHVQDMKRAAEWLAGKLSSLGFEARVYPTPRHPIVYGELLKAPAGAPTVLIYGHYDVQPVEPLELWETPPFEAVIRGDYLFSRGASDMKGQVFATLAAVEAMLQQGEPRINLKYFLEGEEEIGSPSLPQFLKDHTDLLACDFVVNPDTGMIAPDKPTIVYALRGLAYFELKVFGPKNDLHSGMFGGVVHNPAQALAELIAGMHDASGKITLPGFYDSVRPLSSEESSQLARLPMSDEVYLRQTGAPAMWGESGYSPVERTGARPTLEIHGLLSGFTGTGTKTVIPAWAMAKLSCRLVPDQHPDEVAQQLRQYLEQHAPDTIRWDLTYYGGSPASISDLDLPAVRSLARAMETVWGIPPVFKREGGSVPVVTAMQEILGVQSVLTGFGLPDDNVHAPNERMHLPTWKRGQETLLHFLYNLIEGK